MNKLQSPGFHNAVILGKQGAMIYVVDEDGNRLSDGHHYVTWGGHNDDWTGKTDASEESFSVDTSQIEPWNHKLSRKLTLEEVVEYARDKRVAAFAEYLRQYDDAPPDNRVAFGDVSF